jgi:hypothetical protein
LALPHFTVRQVGRKPIPARRVQLNSHRQEPLFPRQRSPPLQLVVQRKVVQALVGQARALPGKAVTMAVALGDREAAIAAVIVQRGEHFGWICMAQTLLIS